MHNMCKLMRIQVKGRWIIAWMGLCPDGFDSPLTRRGGEYARDWRLTSWLL
jgi:hypothetical protein